MATGFSVRFWHCHRRGFGGRCRLVGKQVFPDTIGSIGMKNRIITVQGAQVGITTRREQDYISLTDMVQRQH
jgi:hypothetical protein